MKNTKPVNDIIFNFFLDMRKKDIDKRQRAVLLAKYLEDNKISSRALSEELGISHSTLNDWLLINRIPEDDYDKYKEDGMTDTSIYRMLRNNKSSTKDDFDMLMFKQEIKKSISKYNALIEYGNEIDGELYASIKQLVNILNRVMIHKERNLEKYDVKYMNKTQKLARNKHI